jgi:hypothetical protein
MEKKELNKSERPISYPRPTETDNQLQNQPEFIDVEPNSTEELERNRGSEEQENRGSETGK